jgi:hypothetical protein
MAAPLQLPFLNWKPSIQRFSKPTLSALVRHRKIGGLTLLELTVASVVALTVLSVAIGLMVEQRRQFLGDRTRAGVNDNLRISADLIGIDIKQAGERLESDTELPGLSIIPGTPTTAPDRLVLQRQLLTEKLPVCQNIIAGTGNRTIDVSVMTSPNVANCVYSYTAPSPSEPSVSLSTLQPTENLRSWRSYRCSLDSPATTGTDPCARTTNISNDCQQLGGADQECSWAYIHDPVNNRGEFFLYSFEQQAPCATITFPAPTTRTCLRLQRADAGAWQNSYTYNPNGPITDQPQLYLLEEKEYRLTPDPNTSRTDDFILELSINRQPAQRLANQLANFQAEIQISPSATPPVGCNTAGWCTTFNSNLFYENDWQDLQAVKITLDSINPNEQLLNTNSGSNYLTLSSQFLPRNVASR